MFGRMFHHLSMFVLVVIVLYIIYRFLNRREGKKCRICKAREDAKINYDDAVDEFEELCEDFSDFEEEDSASDTKNF